MPAMSVWDWVKLLAASLIISFAVTTPIAAVFLLF